LERTDLWKQLILEYFTLWKPTCDLEILKMLQGIKGCCFCLFATKKEEKWVESCSKNMYDRWIIDVVQFCQNEASIYT